MAPKELKNKEQILLHICCGVCATYVVKKLQSQFEIIGFFYNPNIHPESEYLARKEAAFKLAEVSNISLIVPPYQPEEYFNALEVFKNPVEVFSETENGFFYIPSEKRCPVCYKIRLEKTAQYAFASKIKYFTTTLLISPYQNHQLINQIGQNIAQRLDLEYYSDNFQKGFYQSKVLAKEYNLYRQKYCGCIFSKKDAGR